MRVTNPSDIGPDTRRHTSSMVVNGREEVCAQDGQWFLSLRALGDFLAVVIKASNANCLVLSAGEEMLAIGCHADSLDKPTTWTKRRLQARRVQPEIGKRSMKRNTGRIDNRVDGCKTPVSLSVANSNVSLFHSPNWHLRRTCGVARWRGRRPCPGSRFSLGHHKLQRGVCQAWLDVYSSKTHHPCGLHELQRSSR